MSKSEMKCEKCCCSAKELFPLAIGHVCIECFPAEKFSLYPGWSVAGGEAPRRKRLEKGAKRR